MVLAKYQGKVVILHVLYVIVKRYFHSFVFIYIYM